jgi:hypothetical protein
MNCVTNIIAKSSGNVGSAATSHDVAFLRSYIKWVKWVKSAPAVVPATQHQGTVTLCHPGHIELWIIVVRVLVKIQLNVFHLLFL